MTALTQYERLEAPGIWRAAPDAQRVNVIVSIGDATLTISDGSERALAHWSLAAIHRLNGDAMPALYAPSDMPDEVEALEISDEDMVAAIEKVRRVIERNRPRAGRLRLILTLAAFALGLFLAVTWLPDALKRQTLAVLPQVTRASVGERLLVRVQRVSGAPCAGAFGSAALAKLGARVLGDVPARLVVVSSGVAQAAHLPGGIILVNRAVIEDYEEPDVAAGFILVEAERARLNDPMAALLDHAGLWATARLLTTGALEDHVLDSYAEVLLTRPATMLPEAALLARFEAAKVRSTPYAFALDQTGETTLRLIEADPVPLEIATPLLADSDWVSLQGICAD